MCVIYCTLIRYRRNIKYFQSQVAKQSFCNAAIAVSFQSYGAKGRKTDEQTDGVQRIMYEDCAITIKHQKI